MVRWRDAVVCGGISRSVVFDGWRGGLGVALCFVDEAVQVAFDARSRGLEKQSLQRLCMLLSLLEC